MITACIEGGWLRARNNAGPWVIISNAEGVSNVRVQRKSETLFYIHFERKEQQRKRMLCAVGNEITVGPDLRSS